MEKFYFVFFDIDDNNIGSYTVTAPSREDAIDEVEHSCPYSYDYYEVL